MAVDRRLALLEDPLDTLKALLEFPGLEHASELAQNTRGGGGVLPRQLAPVGAAVLPA
jgi:hypothetical protein